MIKTKLTNRLLTLLSACLLTTTVVSADDCCDPCDMGYLGGFTVGADFLLWKPCVDNTDYASVFTSSVATTADNTGRRACVEHDWEPGFRLNVTKGDFWCGWDLTGSYTYLCDTAKDSVSSATAGTVVSQLVHPAFQIAGNAATAKHKLQYQTFDVLMGFDCTMCDCHVVHPFFGIEGVFINQDLNHTVTDGAAIGTTRCSYDTWAVGFKAGTAYSYAVCDGFNFFSRASMTIGAGEVDQKSAHSDGTVTYNFISNEDCHCVCGGHIQAGFEYVMDVCGCSTTLRAGWEFLQWKNIASPRRFHGTANGAGIADSTGNSNGTVGFNGLFVGAEMSF